MTTPPRPLAATLDEAEAAMRGFMGFLNATQEDAQSGDPSRRPDMDAVQKVLADWTSRLSGLAAELAATRPTLSGAAAGEAALAEYLLAMSSQGTPTATAADITGNLSPDDPCFERWVVGTDATRLVFGCMHAAEAASGATHASDFVARMAKSHPHPLVRAHAEYFVASQELEQGVATGVVALEDYVARGTEIAARAFADYPAELARATASLSPPSDDMAMNRLAEALPIGAPAPAFDVALIGGGRATLEQFRGRPLLLQFTATWCGPCQQELPHLLALHQRYRDRGLQVLAIAVDDDLEALPEYIQLKGIPWQVAPASSSDPVLAAYPVVGVPNLVVLDGDGVVRAVDVRVSLQGPHITAILDSMLEASPS